MPVLAADRVRFVGEAVAMVVAETAGQALDAAEAVEVVLDPLTAASDVERAMAPGAPAIWPDAPGNIALDWEDGDARGGRCRIRTRRQGRARPARWIPALLRARWSRAPPLQVSTRSRSATR